MMAIIFKSEDDNVIFPIACKNTTPFVEVEKKFYKKYPEFRNHDNVFKLKNKKIKRFMTMEENNIIDGNSILIEEQNEEIAIKIEGPVYDDE